MDIRRYCATFGLTLAILLTIYSKGLATPANARQAVLELNPANTHIDYTLQGWPHVTHGTFKLARGTIRIDPATGQADGSGRLRQDRSLGGTGFFVPHPTNRAVARLARSMAC